jgi:hypothetical protein
MDYAKFGMEVNHKFCMKFLYALQITNMKEVEVFEVVSGNSQEAEIYTGGKL